MHPNRESPPGYWEVEDDPPDPTVAETDAEFVAELRVLVQWSGLSLSEIEQRMRAYDGFLPEGIVSNALHAGTLPSEDLLAQLLWALGCDDEALELWIWARGRLAAAEGRFDPAEVYWVPDESKGFSTGTLAHAVQERRDLSGWPGLHRRAIPDDRHAKHQVSKRRRSKGSSRVIIGLVAAGVIAFAAGVAAALSGGNESAAPSAESLDGQECCLATSPGSLALEVPLVSDPPNATPTPSASIKPVVNPTPRPTSTTPGPQPTPTQTQTQPPQLAGSASTACVRQDGVWFVDINVITTLTGALSGTDPQGQATYGGTAYPFSLSGSGGTSFGGQARVNAGPDTAPVSGTIAWSVTVTLPVGSVSTSGNEGFSCS